MSPATLTPKHWSEFQHYRDRRPPWIKLHRSILDDHEYFRLPIASRALAPCLWLLASEYSGGAIPEDYGVIAFRMHCTEKEARTWTKPLIEQGFMIRASDLLAECLQGARPEREREREVEVEVETERAQKIRAVGEQTFAAPNNVTEEAWLAYLEVRVAKRAKMTPGGYALLCRKLEACNGTADAAVRKSAENGWTGVFPDKHMPDSEPDYSAVHTRER